MSAFLPVSSHWLHLKVAAASASTSARALRCCAEGCVLDVHSSPVVYPPSM